MTMIDMKFTKSEKKDEAKEAMVGPSGQPADYPWGLCIRLESEELNKLGLTEPPKVGEPINFSCVGRVTSFNQQSRMGGEEETAVGIQIEQMEIDGDA